jgi:hypothetical protein
MAYLMSDVAAGSNAALQLQQNMAAAPDVQQTQANKMQEQQLILQQNKDKIQQDAATLQKTRLANIVSETDFKSSEESKVKLQQLIETPEAKDALLKNDKIAFMNLVLPIQLAAGDSVNASNTMKTISELEFKKVQTDLKQHEKNRETFGNALASVRSANETQMPDIVARMPEEMKAAIKSQVPGFFEEKDTKLQKAQLEALVANGSNKNDMATNEMRLKLLDGQIQVKEEMLKIQQQIFENKKLTGNTKEDKTEERQYAQARRDASRIDSLYKKPLEEAEAEFKKATEEDSKSRLFGIVGSKIERAKSDEDKAALKSTQAWRRLQDLQKDIIGQKLDALEGMPEGKEKDRLFEAYNRQIRKIDGVVEPVPIPQRDEKSSGAPMPQGIPGLGSGDIAPKPSSMSTFKPDARTSPAQATAKTVPSNKQPTKLTGEQKDAAISKAIEAIKNGADPEKVKARLKEAGVSLKE